MLKSQLIKLIGRKQDHFPEEDIASSINTVLDKMVSHLVHGGRIEIRGFGSPEAPIYVPL